MSRRSDDNHDISAAATLSSSDASLDETLPSDSFARVDITKGTDAPPAPEPEVPRGTVIGRYIVLDRLGSGTMGLVLSAMDPALDRKVAIKLVRADAEGSTIGRQRLQREAQAMARLAHPNVVTVYEVGTYGDRVFLAMEYVQGETLAEWLGGRHTQREVVQTFLAAGHGLAAAHRAGIVHRDFKPTNVLVARDGRVRVADFGLATAQGRATTPPPIEIESVADLAMTKTGAILGTPAYMAPEQHRAQGADARADQFAFCVALYEALYSELPFEGKEYVVYAENVIRGRLREPPRGSHVPARVRKVLVRGLAVDPEARYPNMDALLADLARDPAALRRRIAIGGGVAALVSVTAVLTMQASGPDRGDPCASADQPISALWNTQARQRMHDAFTRSGTRDANAMFAQAAKAVDARTTELKRERRDACLAVAAHRGESDDLSHRRMQCIDRQVGELEAMLGVLSDNVDEPMVLKSGEAVARLPAASLCADRAALRGVLAPSAFDLRVKVSALEHQLDRAQALDDTGKPKQAFAMLDALLPEIDRTGHPPLRARGHFLHAKAASSLGKNEEALAELRGLGELAAEAQDDRLIARGWVLMHGVLGYRLARFDDAKSIEPSVAAMVIRAGNTDELRCHFENSKGAVELTRGDYAKSAEHFTAAAALATKAFGPTHPITASSLGNAATALEGAGRFAEARAALDRSMAIHREMLGPDHPLVGTGHYRLGSLLDTMGKPKEALVEFEKAAAIDDKVYSSDHPEQAQNYVSLGVVLVELDRAKEALDYQLRAVAIFRANINNNERKLIVALMDLANTYRALRRHPDAIKSYDEALANGTKLYGPDHVEIADILQNMAYELYLTGAKPRARELWKRALAIREAKLGKDHPEVAKSLGVLAQDAHDSGDHAASIGYLDRAIAILEKQKLPLVYEMLDIRGQDQLALRHHAEAIRDLTRARDGYLEQKLSTEAAKARLVLADALWAKTDRAAAIQEAKAAVAELAKPEDQKLAHAWLAKHR